MAGFVKRGEGADIGGNPRRGVAAVELFFFDVAADAEKVVLVLQLQIAGVALGERLVVGVFALGAVPDVESGKGAAIEGIQPAVVVG